ncbi:mid region of cactin-domain-containing protein [Gamsiella multidivaricata]|uniref:mid region of cactin-domain-containing protein n=1 Tax=Gamsiella multidivaricata TaxID=101098 RepID=UPI0022210348|nr:mid region of cactin-domain-containing protein [Gamsiella multidivaricata]KAI7820999.1 mid region of cactin-domain-containing protein [Gamsiella multidivaricata]
MTNYSNSDNPFNDVNLAQKFTWAKKREVEKKKGISAAESARRDIARREEARIELEKLTKKRAEREREREEREEELVRIQRASEQAQLGDWQAQEEEFYLKQAKRRAEIRIKSNRAKPIDILAMNIKLIAEDTEENEEDEEEDDIGLEIDVEEPYTIFDNLSLEEVQELLHDIKFYLSLDKADQTTDFWRAMLIVCEDKLSELDSSRAEQSVVAPHIAQDIANKLAGKSHEELTLLQGQIQRKLAGGGAIDVDYWEALLKTLIVWKAKAKLNMIHQLILQKRLEQLKMRQLKEAEKEKAELAAVLAMQTLDVEGDVRGLREINEDDIEYAQEDEDLGMDGVAPSAVPYDRAMSPEPFDTLAREDQNLAIVDQWDDWAEILEKRGQVLSKQFNPKKKSHDQDTGEQHPDDDFVSKILFDKEAAKQLAGNEEVFNVEASLQRQQTYMWQDKYRPRKPRFFNRVHTGYEWNKYNQTHYDHDNPPPKVVQGYKFNLFYPDLIDKSQAPTYEIIKEPDTNDTVLIKFKAGPPYEDIAFRIVNREWEHSHKRGYKSVFDRGVLQLHFNFKRQFYRR